jgi:hypothetical protein
MNAESLNLQQVIADFDQWRAELVQRQIKDERRRAAQPAEDRRFAILLSIAMAAAFIVGMAAGGAVVALLK